MAGTLGDKTNITILIRRKDDYKPKGNWECGYGTWQTSDSRVNSEVQSMVDILGNDEKPDPSSALSNIDFSNLKLKPTDTGYDKAIDDIVKGSAETATSGKTQWTNVRFSTDCSDYEACWSPPDSGLYRADGSQAPILGREQLIDPRIQTTATMSQGGSEAKSTTAQSPSHSSGQAGDAWGEELGLR